MSYKNNFQNEDNAFENNNGNKKILTMQIISNITYYFHTKNLC